MVDWKIINQKIMECRKTPNPVTCLSKLFTDTQDGMVAFALAEEYEKLQNLIDALKYFQEAEKRFPLEKYKNMAREGIKRVKLKLQEQSEPTDDTLFIVSCTKEKIWDSNPNALQYVPAKDAYIGKTIRNWLDNPLSSQKRWLILSSKYGFIEPNHPICNYDVSFNDEKTGPISDETLRRQVLHQCRWKDKKPIRDFKNIVVLGGETYFEKVKSAFLNTGVTVTKFESKGDIPVEERITVLQTKLSALLSARSMEIGKLRRGDFPEQAGVYIIYEKADKKPLYIGTTDNLKRRIWNNHLKGNIEASTLRRKLYQNLKSEAEITKFIENCSIKFLTIDTPEILKSLEHFAIAVLNPELND
jgi:hypothetical protein